MGKQGKTNRPRNQEEEHLDMIMKQYQKSPSITNGSGKRKLWRRGLWRRIGKG